MPMSILLSRKIIAAAVGAAAGFAWYYFVGCTTGTCPISSNPYISTAYGALVGLLLYPAPKKSAGEEKKPGGEIK